MPTVAEQLRTAREARKLTVQHVAETTKIRTDHIRALEEGRYSVFSAPVYIRGFVRTYATLVKLDVAQVMHDLDTELAGTTKFREPPPLSTHPKSTLDFVMLQLSRVNWRKGVVVFVAAVVLLLIFLVVGLMRQHKHNDPLSGLPPAVYRPANNDTLPLPTAPQRRQ